MTLTHPNNASIPKDGGVAFLYPFAYNIPYQATLNDGGSGRRIVRYLGEPPKIDVGPLC